MLEIDTLRLTLPAGFGARAARIGRLVAEQLAVCAGDLAPGRIDTLVLPALHIAAGWSDQRIALRVADALGAALQARCTADTAARPAAAAGPVHPLPPTGGA